MTSSHRPPALAVLLLLSACALDLGRKGTTPDEEVPEVDAGVGEPDAGDPDAVHLGTDGLAWDSHVDAPLTFGSGPDFVLNVCESHFPDGSEVRAGIDGAAEVISSVPGSVLYLPVTQTKHLPVDVLFASPPVSPRMEYVDVNASGYPGYPCHPASEISCSDWVMNTCKYTGGAWNGAGTHTTAFNISTNANCYAHYADPTSSDDPGLHGVLHELGHGAGMIHSPSWPEADRGLLSIMQGRIPMLTAYDVAFLRHVYPTAAPVLDTNLAASHAYRATTGSSYQNCPFGDFGSEKGFVPAELYVTAFNQLRDCATRQAPKVGVAWFNLGTTAVPDVLAKITLSNPSTGRTVVLKTWRTAAMPAMSQGQWAGTLDPVLPATPFPPGVDLEIRFAVDVGNKVTESNENDNHQSGTTRFVVDESHCSASTVTACHSYIP